MHSACVGGAARGGVLVSAVCCLLSYELKGKRRRGEGQEHTGCDSVLHR